MKRIGRLQGPTPGLEAYLNECHAGEESWAGFRNHAAGASYRELVKGLAALQRGLCGYCEIDLTAVDRQVEHVIPRSDPNQGASEELNCGNMMACCLGGTAKNFHGPDAAGDDERFLQPMSDSLSCGQAKQERSDDEFVDPRTLPALPSVIKVYPTGEIEADPLGGEPVDVRRGDAGGRVVAADVAVAQVVREDQDDVGPRRRRGCGRRRRTRHRPRNGWPGRFRPYPY